MVSGNDSAVALAEFVSGSVENFANLMNEKASFLGLTSTHFVTPHGLDEDEHYTTAFELAKIADYALKNEIFSKIVSTSYYTVKINGKSKTLHNTNELLGNFEGVYGVKTGFTNGANRCLVTSCKKNDLDIICVVLGCDTKKNRTLDSVKILNYIFNNFHMIDVKKIINDDFTKWNNSQSKYIFFNKCSFANPEYYLDESQILYDKVAVDKNLNNNIFTSVYSENYFDTPLYSDSVIGKISIFNGDTELFSVNILNKNTIGRKTFLEYFKIFFKKNIFEF